MKTNWNCAQSSQVWNVLIMIAMKERVNSWISIYIMSYGYTHVPPQPTNQQTLTNQLNNHLIYHAHPTRLTSTLSSFQLWTIFRKFHFAFRPTFAFCTRQFQFQFRFRLHTHNFRIVFNQLYFVSNYSSSCELQTFLLQNEKRGKNSPSRVRESLAR